MPPALTRRPRDRRGFPIFHTVFVDPAGVPHFTVTDPGRVTDAIFNRRCGICGRPLKDDAWLIGGPYAAFLYRGLYLDPPMHRACAEYALQVCPFLARRDEYSKRIDGRTVRGQDRVRVIEAGIPDTNDQPITVLGLVRELTIKEGLGDHFRYLQPSRPWPLVAFWRNGAQLTFAEACEHWPKLRELDGAMIERVDDNGEIRTIARAQLAHDRSN